MKCCITSSSEEVGEEAAHLEQASGGRETCGTGASRWRPRL